MLILVQCCISLDSIFAGPPPKLDIHEETFTNSSVTFAWEGPSSEYLISHYEVTQTFTGPSPQPNVTITTTETSLTVDLSPGNTVTVTVVAVDRVMRKGERSDPVVFTLGGEDKHEYT